jgi:hypothetical protein
VVAIIDTGLDYTHEDLRDCVWINEKEIADNGIDDDGNGYIDDVYGWNFYHDNNKVYVGIEDDHGTHAAGTIAACADNGTGIAGIAGNTGNVKIMALKALGGKDGSGSTQDVIEAIRYAEANGASIVNLSLGCTKFDYALYLTMKNSSLLFVVAAGNEGTDNDATGTYPACFDLDNIISVANLEPDGTLHSSSNYGASTVDITAPGTCILSTTTNHTYGYMTVDLHGCAHGKRGGGADTNSTYYSDVSLSDVKQIVLGSAARLDALDNLVASGGMLDCAGGAQLRSVRAGQRPNADGRGRLRPAIAYESYTQNGVNFLKVSVTDPEDNFCLLCYEQGERDAQYFQYGHGRDTGHNGCQIIPRSFASKEEEPIPFMRWICRAMKRS